MTAEELLDTPVGRRMVEAAKVWSEPWATVKNCTHEALAREAIAAALRVALDEGYQLVHEGGDDAR